MSEQEWRDVCGYVGFYQVSNDGLVKSMVRVKTGRVMKGSVGNHGYRHVCLTVDGKEKHCTVHRLVAQAFIENPENKETVDHIDRDKLNNQVSNLRWATKAENEINKAGRSDTGHKHISKTLNRGRPAFELRISRNYKSVVRKWFPIKGRAESEVLAQVLAYRDMKYNELGIDIVDK
jgi:hypothetical protein